VMEPGAAIGRDIAKGESVEAEIDAFISRRDAHRRKSEGDRGEEEAFMVSERAYFARLEAERRAARRDLPRGPGCPPGAHPGRPRRLPRSRGREVRRPRPKEDGMTTKIDQNRQEFDRKVAQIRGYADFTEEAKRRMMAEAYEEASGRHRELVAEQERKAAERLGRLERGVMGIRYPLHVSDGDKELARMSYRDAYDRAERTAGEAVREGAPEKLEALLGRAERSGDPHLADAVYHVCTERGLRGVADSYLESRPAERKRWEEYAEARREAEAHPLERALFGAGGVGPLKPAELGGSKLSFRGGGRKL